jgi:hypothetical protein
MTVRRAADKGEKEGVKTEMVDAPEVTVTKDEAKALSDEQTAELEAVRERAQAVTEATKDTVSDPVVESASDAEISAPKKAGTVKVKVVHDVFNYIDESGFYQSVAKGEEVKVTAAQADRGEELGAVERV